MTGSESDTSLIQVDNRSWFRAVQTAVLNRKVIANGERPEVLFTDRNPKTITLPCIYDKEYNMRFHCNSLAICSVVLLGMSLGITNSHADLILTIDTTNETYRFDGTMVFDPEPISSGIFTNWDARVTTKTGVGDLEDESDQLDFEGISSDSLFSFLHFGRMTTAGVTTGVQIDLLGRDLSDPGTTTFTGDGLDYSYSAFAADGKAFLATTPTFGSNEFVGTTSDSFTVQFASVPEPSSTMLCIWGAVGYVAALRRKKK